MTRMAEAMRKTKAKEQGVCCEYCQEDVNVHRCNTCMQRFEDDDVIFCDDSNHLTGMDSIHYHFDCKP